MVGRLCPHAPLIVPPFKNADELWNPAGAATTSSAAAIAIDKVTIPSSLNPQHPHPHRHVAAGLPPTDAAAGVGMVGAAAAAGLTDESMVLIAQTLGRGLQVRAIYTYNA